MASSAAPQTPPLLGVILVPPGVVSILMRETTPPCGAAMVVLYSYTVGKIKGMLRSGCEDTTRSVTWRPRWTSRMMRVCWRATNMPHSSGRTPTRIGPGSYPRSYAKRSTIKRTTHKQRRSGRFSIYCGPFAIVTFTRTRGCRTRTTETLCVNC